MFLIPVMENDTPETWNIAHRSMQASSLAHVVIYNLQPKLKAFNVGL